MNRLLTSYLSVIIVSDIIPVTEDKERFRKVTDSFDDLDELTDTGGADRYDQPRISICRHWLSLGERTEFFLERLIPLIYTVSCEINIWIIPGMLLIEATDGIRVCRVGDIIHPVVGLPVGPDI